MAGPLGVSPAAGRPDLEATRATEAVRRAPEEAAAPAGPSPVEARRLDRVAAARAGDEVRAEADRSPREDAVDLQRDAAEGRARGERLAEAATRLGRLQSAERTLSEGLRDLGRFEAVARRAADLPEGADRESERAEAATLTARLDRADRDADVRRARLEARLAEQRVADPRPEGAGPTLTLRPRPESPGEFAVAQAQRIAAEARDAEREARAGGDDEPVLRPEIADVGTRARARASADAAVRSTERATALAEDVRLRTRRAGDESEALVRALPDRGAPPARDESEARAAAERAARATAADPGRALAAQPFLTAEVASRLLA
jgi:hypothetical protein